MLSFKEFLEEDLQRDMKKAAAKFDVSKQVNKAASKLSVSRHLNKLAAPFKSIVNKFRSIEAA